MAKQTRKPDLTLIISDCSEEFLAKTKNVVNTYENTLIISFSKNQRASNLSGSVNTGLSILKEKGFSLVQTFVAFLDDDDWWAPNYLENCLNYAIVMKVDWVISGLIRYDETAPKGSFQNIPEQLSVPDFLVSNPNIQGSNLFVRFGKMVEIDGFDEGLVSTTDRDVCIQLLESNNITYGVLKRHLVHHWAFLDEDRLSIPGSETKTSGLQQFYLKYQHRMNDKQKALFKKRARD